MLKTVLTSVRTSPGLKKSFIEAIAKVQDQYAWRLADESKVLRMLMRDFVKHVESGGKICLQND